MESKVTKVLQTLHLHDHLSDLAECPVMRRCSRVNFMSKYNATDNTNTTDMSIIRTVNVILTSVAVYHNKKSNWEVGRGFNPPLWACQS